MDEQWSFLHFIKRINYSGNIIVIIILMGAFISISSKCYLMCKWLFTFTVQKYIYPSECTWLWMRILKVYKVNGPLLKKGGCKLEYPERKTPTTSLKIGILLLEVKIHPRWQVYLVKMCRVCVWYVRVCMHVCARVCEKLCVDASLHMSLPP